jgi:GTPase
VAVYADPHRHTGVNVALLMLAALRTPEVIGRAMQSPYPRLRALLRAVGEVPYDVEEDRDVRFCMPADAMRSKATPMLTVSCA